MLRPVGMVHLAKARPAVGTTADGTWQVLLRVVDRIGPHQAEAWTIVYAGEAARAWWEAEGRTLEPGDSLQVELERVRMHGVARDRHGSTSELHAHALAVALVARARKEAAAA